MNAKSLDQAIGSANVELRGINALLSAGKFEAAYQQSSEAAADSRGSDRENTRRSCRWSGAQQHPFRAEAGSLVRQAEFEKSLPTLRGGENQLAGGDFEDLDQLRRLGWQHIEDPLAGIQSKVQLSGRGPQEGRYCLELSAQAATAASGRKIVARPLVWITSPPVRATAGEVLEISGWVRVSPPMSGSIDGLEIVDSLGGPELSLRVRSTQGWQPFRHDPQHERDDRNDGHLRAGRHRCGVGRWRDGPLARRGERQTAADGESEPGPAFPNSARRTLFSPPIQR